MRRRWASLVATTAVVASLALMQPFAGPAGAQAADVSGSGTGIGAASGAPTGLVTDSLAAPMDVDQAGGGLDFGWQSRVGQQSAYEIRVSAGDSDDAPAVWDSSRIASDASTAVPYGGGALKPAERYSWRVRVWDEQGRPTAWSRPALFGTGPGRTWGSSRPIWSAPPSQPAWTDYRLDLKLAVTRTALGVKFRSPDSRDGYMWQFRASNAATPNSLVPHIETNGSYKVGTPVPLGTALNPDTTHDVAIEVTGSTIRTYLDGNLVDSRTDTTYSQGGIGLRTGSTETGTVDDITVTSLVPAESGKALYAEDFGAADASFPCGTVQDRQLVIGTSQDCLSVNTTDDWALMRRDFALAPGKTVDWATAFATGSSFDAAKQYVYKMYLDGGFVGLGPTESFGTETRYDGFDVTKALTTGGAHTLSAIAYTTKDQRFQAYLVIRYTDGSTQTVGTGPDWRTRSGATVWPSARSIGTSYWSAPQEDITMSAYPDGFGTPGFDDSSWSGAAVKNAFTDLEPTPFAKVTEQLRAPVRITDKGNGDYLVDFGRTWQGGVHLTLTGTAGRRVTLRFGEELSGPDTVRYQLRAGNTYQDVVTMRYGTQTVDTWGMRVFRYLDVIGSPVPVTTHDLQALALVYPFDESQSQLTSSNPDLVSVWQLSKDTVETTDQNFYTDSWTRERGPYEADNYIHQLASLYLSGDPTLGEYSMEYFTDHSTWPQEWPLYVISSVYDNWQRTGSLAQVKRMYSALTGKLLSKQFNPVTGTIDESDAIVDWPAGERDGYVFAARNTILNALSYSNYRDMAAMATALGRTDDAAGYTRTADTLRTTLNSAFWNASKGAYDDGLDANMKPTGHFALQASAFPAAFGVPASEQQYAGVAAYMASRGMACGVYCSGFLLQGLYNAGDAQAALDLLTSDSTNSWRHMIDLGAGATGEAWDPAQKSNMTWSHAWAAAPAYVIPRDMYGVAPTSPGYRTFTVTPQPGDQTYGSVSTPTVKGTVAAAFHKQSGRTDLGVLVPGNSTATVSVPVTDGDTGDTVYVDGLATPATRDNGRLAVAVGVGCHVLSTSADPGVRGDQALTGICRQTDDAGDAPTGSLATTARHATTGQAVPVTLTLDQQVTGLTAADIQVANGTASAPARHGTGAAGTTWTFTVTPDGRGPVRVRLPAAAVHGTTGSANLPVTPLVIPGDAPTSG
ncbi:family 78 glycoside hydrolase catalytic domain [Actinacidiphila acididurans]|uniref:alpha-L-rhamnosidase n=1 Tax=Actinacidiphila acididurans TaxID=2784346 RepID=A0ABS2TLR0_9ACTN|nr:family 78 glycoside hydrolase catalytic domain [Actinacidiphila acididurans]MBM9504276.1 family 78 glycoside hydrolase catalytic domain [Actinacidiphila acididurans]